jgi:hypothetical protein
MLSLKIKWQQRQQWRQRWWIQRSLIQRPVYFYHTSSLKMDSSIDSSVVAFVVNARWVLPIVPERVIYQNYAVVVGENGNTNNDCFSSIFFQMKKKNESSPSSLHQT